MGRRAKLALLLAGATLAALYACADPYAEAEPGVDAGPSADAAGDATSDNASPTDDSATPVDAGDAGTEAGASYRAAVMATGPVAYWRLGEKIGVTAKDELGGRDCVYQGAITLGAAGALTNDTNTSVHGEGTNGSAQCGDTLDFAGNVPFSVEAWVKPDLIDTDYRRVIAKRVGGEGWAIFCQSNSNGCVFEMLTGDGGPSRACGVTVPANAYSHLVATYDTTTLRVYLNGIAACNTIGAVVLPNTSIALVIGAYSTGGNYFQGNLDEIAVYDKALSPQQAKAHYQAR